MKRFLLTAFAIAIILVTAPGPAVKAGMQDGASAWTELGPPGGSIIALARNPKAPSELYALAHGYPGQFFKSTNNGTSWKRTTFVESPSDVAVDPTNPNNVYILSSYRLYKSTNKGSTFTEIAFPSGVYGEGRMAVHPKNPQVLYVIGGFYSSGKTCLALHKSMNGGQAWTTRKFDTNFRSAEGTGIVVSPQDPNTIYFCGWCYDASWNRYSRVYRTSNGGNTWKNITGPILKQTGQEVYGLALDPKNKSRIFAAYRDGVLRSSNGGAAWTKHTGSAFAAGAVAIDPAKPNTLYAPGLYLGTGVLKSTDGGANWQAYKTGYYGGGQAILGQGSTVHAGTSAGIFRSKNAGVSYQAAHSGLKAPYISTFALAPSSPGTIFAEASQYTYFKTTNGGASWVKGTDFYRCESILNFAIHPGNPNQVLILAGG